MALPGVVIKIGAETASAVTAIDKVSDAMGRQAGAGGKWAAGLKAAQGPALAAIAGLAAGSAFAVSQASELEQAQGALAAVFGPSTKAMEANAKAAADIGLSQADYSQQAATLGATLANQGVSADALAGQTDALLQSSADMAAQFGGSTADAVSAVGAAMRGEYDSLEQYGISMKQSDVAARAAADGVSEAEAKMRILNEQLTATGTNGAASRELGTLASQSQVAKAELENAGAAIGTALLPVLATMAGYLAAIAQWMADNSTAVGIFAIVLGTLAAAVVIVNAATAAWAAIQTVLNLALWSSPITWIIAAILALIAIIVLLVLNWDTVVAAIKRVWEWLLQKLRPAFDVVKDAFVTFGTAVKDVWDGIWEKISDIWGKIKGVIDKIEDRVGRVVSAINPFDGRSLDRPGGGGGGGFQVNRPSPQINMVRVMLDGRELRSVVRGEIMAGAPRLQGAP